MLRRGLVAALLCLPLPVGLQLAPTPAHAQSPGVTLSGPVAAEGHGTAPPEEGGTNVYNYCAVLDAAPSHDVVVTATPSPAIVTVDAALTFTPSNWSDKQCFSVRAASSADNAQDEHDRPVTMTHAASSTDASYNEIAIADYAGVSLRDDDATVVSLARVDSGPVTEGGKARFTVSLGRALVAGETVIAPLDFSPWAASGQPGLQPSDFSVAIASGAGVKLAGPIQDCWVVFEAGAQVATLELAAVRDNVADDGERIAVRLGAASRFDDAAHGYRTDVDDGAQPHATAQGFETVLHDFLATVRFDVYVHEQYGTASIFVQEGEALTLSLTLSKPLSVPVTIHLASLDDPTHHYYYDQATADVDYTDGPWAVTFPAGQTRASITIQTTEDTDIEGPYLKREGFDISADRTRLPPGVRLAGPHMVTILIEDDDMALVSFANERATVSESVGTVLIPVTVHRTLSTPFTLEYFWSHRKLNEVRPWRIGGQGQVTVPANATSIDIPFTIVDDDVQEEDKLLRFSMGGDKVQSTSRSNRKYQSFWLTIKGDDGLPFEMSGISDATVEHNSGWRAQGRVKNASGVVTWMLSGADASAFTIDTATGAVSLPTRDHGAPADADGDNVYKATVTATDGAGRTVSTTFKVTVVAATLRVYGPHGITGADNEVFNVREGETAKLTLVLSQALSSPFTVRLNDERYCGPRCAFAATRSVDYPVIPWSATFPAGTVRAHASVPINQDHDNTEYGIEYFNMYVDRSSLPTGVVASGTLKAIIKIHNVDAAPAVSFESTSSEVQEDAGTVNLEVAVAPRPAAPFVLNFSLSGTATPDSDYRIAGMTGNRPIEGVTGNSGTVTVPANAGSVTIPVEIVDDSVEDDGETIEVRLLASSGYAAATPDSVTLTIRNDDGPPALPAAHPLVKYATLVKSFYDRITARHGHGDSASGGWNKRFLKAMGHPDYVDYPQAAVTVADATRLWNHGGPGANAAWNGTVEAVTYAEQYFAGQVTPPTPDPVPVPAVSIAAGADVTEGGSATFILTATPAPAAPLDVTVTVATEGDYGITAGTQTVTIPTTGSHELTLATTGDDADEADGSVSVTVDAGTGYTVGSDSTGTVAIADDDAPALPAAHPVVQYADLIHKIKAWLNDRDPDVNCTPNCKAKWSRVLKALGVPEYQDIAGSAFSASQADANEAAGWSMWQGIGDAIRYAEQYFAGQVTPPDPVSVPAVSIAAGAGVTEGGSATFILTATPAPSAPLDVSVTIAANGDFGIADATQTVTIPTTGSYTLTLATTGDDADEPDGSVSATVDAGTGYTVGAASSGTVAIADDDLPPPEVSVAAKAASITEGGDAVFTVTADRAVAANLAVTLTVSEAAGSDFVAAASEAAHTVTLEAGKSTATLTIETDDDTVDEPDGSVTATLSAGSGYTVASSSNAATVAVSDNDAAPAVPSLSIDDATGPEGTPMVFTIRLSAPSEREVEVFIRARESTPVSARRNQDFHIQRYYVSFRPGETVQRRGFFIRDDSHDDGGETFEVYVSWSDGVPIADGVGVGTITNADPLPAAYLARFGRTVAEAALDGIAGRMGASRTPGMQGTIAGQALSFDPAASGQPAAAQSTMSAATPGASGIPPASHDAALAMASIAQSFGADASAPVSTSAAPGSAADPFGERFGTPAHSRSLTAREALLGSSFTLTGAQDASGGSLAFWGRASQGRFDGAERGDGTDITLDGEVTTGMLGADYARGDWLLGVALTQSSADGGYAAEGDYVEGGELGCPDPDEVLCRDAVRDGDGEVEASLTAAIPYAAVQASERLKLWGAAGYGSGEVTLKTAMGDRYEADTSWTMAAAGLRGALLEAPTEGSGPALALTSDALWARTSSDKTSDLAASDSDATRLRLGLEGSYRMALDGDGSSGAGSGASLVPTVEIGARHDGGDAETGFGVELGGGIAWVDPALGLTLDVSGRTLLAHEDDDLKDRGISAALAFDPDPATQRGPSFSLRQALGGQASDGLDALFATDPLEDRTGSEAASRWTMEVAYGFPAFGGRFTGSPHVGLGLATAARDYSVGWRLTPEGASAPDISLGVEATLRESDTTAPEHRVGFEVRARW